MRRVLSGWRESADFANLSRITFRKRQASVLVLEADNEVVGVAHDYHFACGLTSSPAVDPQSEEVVQVDVAEAAVR